MEYPAQLNCLRGEMREKKVKNKPNKLR